MPPHTRSQTDHPENEDKTPTGDRPTPHDVPIDPEGSDDLEQPGDPQAALIAQVVANAVVQALAFARATNQPDLVKYPKAKDPSMFNSRKHRQLRTWIGENEICFRTAPNLYRAEVAKVMFAGSFLEGDVQTWFTNYFCDPDNVPPFMSDWHYS